MEKKEYNLEELLKKSPSDITKDELDFILEHMNLEDIFAQAVKRNNERFIDLKDEQKN